MRAPFEERMADPKVSHDTAVVADFISIWCRGQHRGRSTRKVTTAAARLGVYGRKPPTMCSECEEHLAYAEERRAYCVKDPKPFCAHCDTHCYRSQERVWQQEMMRYSGPRSWRHGHALDGIRHALEGLALERKNIAQYDGPAASSQPDTEEA